MQSYEEMVYRDIKLWTMKQLKAPGLVETATKNIQTKFNDMVPKKIQNTVTVTIKGLFNSVLFGMKFIPTVNPQQNLTLKQRDMHAQALIEQYKRIAAAEGAGTGAGGFWLAVADFPALIAIKMKFLFELAHIYGFSTKEFSERLFLLYVFQLTYSSQSKKPELLRTILNWEKNLPQEAELKEIDWEEFQREYRDSLDFRKMLQMIPGIGAVVGAWANYGLLKELGYTGINCYRLRLLQIPGKKEI